MTALQGVIPDAREPPKVCFMKTVISYKNEVNYRRVVRQLGKSLFISLILKTFNEK